jgi:hypothetical protein
MKLQLSIIPVDAPAYPFELKGPACRIGRDPSGEVALNTAGVSWEHARIDLTPGGADLSDLGSTNGTYLNGRRLTARTALQPGDQIRLGQQGPTLQVKHLHGAAAAPLLHAPTLPAPRPRQAPQADKAAPPSATRYLLMKVQENFGALQNRHRKLLIGIAAAVVLVAVVLGGGLVYFSASHSRRLADADARRADDARRAENELEKVRHDQEERDRRLEDLRTRNEKEIAKLREAGADDKETDIYAKYSDAVYFVVAPLPGGRTTVGTAFAVDPAGKFGTNAHVALPVQQSLEAGEKPLLVSHGGLRQYEIASARAHHRYTGVLSHDVGLLSVNLPPGEKLPTTVRLASQDDLRKLKPGTRLLYMGFPVYQADFSDYFDIDRAAGVVAVKPSKVNARTYRGTLNRLLTFTNEKGDFSNEFLLEHDLPGMPGASGSALFSPDGKVVGLLNGMMNVKGKFEAGAPNKTGVRVDLLRELLDG